MAYVYSNGEFVGIEHYHDDCYSRAGMPHGEPADKTFGRHWLTSGKQSEAG